MTNATRDSGDAKAADLQDDSDESGDPVRSHRLRSASLQRESHGRAS